MSQQPPPSSNQQQQQQQPQYAYSPPPAELPYYNALFAAADKSSSGYLSGQTAVEFFFLSKLPIDLLKQIWTMADQPPSNTLDPKKFYVAVRLIQLFQNGKKPIDLMLNVGEADRAGLRAPFFEGVDVQATMAHLAQQQQHQQQQQGGQLPVQQQQQQQPQQQQQQPSPPMMPYQPQQQQQQPSPMPYQQPQQQQQQPSPMPYQQQQQQPYPPIPSGGGGAVPVPSSGSTTILAVQDPYTMTPQELSRYESLFPSYAQPDPEGGGSYVHGAAAVELFGKSGMDRESLKSIWAMVDDPVDNKLDSIEFAIAMHLIVCVTKKGLPKPPSLPPSLASLARYSHAGGQQAAGFGGGGGGGAAAQPMQQQPAQQQQQPLVGGMVGGGQPQPIPSPLSSPRAAVAGMGMQQQPQMVGGMGGMGGGGFGGGGMPSPIPSPTITPRIGTVGKQPPSMNGGMMQIPQLPVHQHTGMQQQYLQPHMQGQQPGMQQQSQMGGGAGMPQMGFQQHGGFGGVSTLGGGFGDASTVGGGSTIDEAFAGLSNNPVEDIDGYSTAGSDASPAAALVMQNQQISKQQKHHAHLPPKSPKGHAKFPPVAASARARPRSSSPGASSVESSEELSSLRRAHQKLQAEVVSLRAKAASVSDEEYEVQREIKNVAKEIGKLSLELSALKESVMEAQVKLRESVGVLKVQVGKKESIEAQLTDARATQESLVEAAAAVDEANELAMTYAARAVAAAAATATATEDHSLEQVAVTAPGIVETADLFSWDNPPAPAPSAGMDKSSHSLTRETQQPEPSHAPWGSSESVAHSVHSNQGSWGAPPTPDRGGGHYRGDSHSVISMGTNASYMKYGVLGGEMGAPIEAPGMEGESATQLDNFIPEPTGPIYPEYQSMAPTPKATSHQPMTSSPTKEDMDALKSRTFEAEKSFRSYSDLMRSISTDVEKLESAAKKAEADVSAIGGTKSKSKMGFGKSKAKKEYEHALQTAQAERDKVEEAKAKLAAVELEAEGARREMERLRQQYEEMEMEAATAQSYLSVQKEAYHGHQQAAMQPSAAGGYQQQNQYNDPFGMVPASTSSASHGYGTSNSADGDYDNPFAM